MYRLTLLFRLFVVPFEVTAMILLESLMVRVACLQRSTRTTRTVMFAEATQLYPLHALRYLDHLMSQTPCRAVLLEHNRSSLRAITDCLKNVTVGLFTTCLLSLHIAVCIAAL